MDSLFRLAAGGLPRGHHGGGNSSIASPQSNSSLVDSIPATILDSLVPGFGLASRVFSTYFGIDLSRIVSTVFVLAAFLTAWRQARRVFNYFLDDLFGASIVIESNDELYAQVMDWISEHVVTQNARTLTASTKKHQPWEARVDASDQVAKDHAGIFNFRDFDARFPPAFKPAHGSHRFWFRGRVFWLDRARSSTTPRLANPYSAPKEEETVSIKTLGRRTDPIKRLLDECKAHYATKERESTSVSYADTSRGMPYWKNTGLRPTRPLDTIYLDRAEKRALLEDMHDFLHPSAWRFYSRRGIPYRRGYLFYGQPGTGKTSLSLALAGMFGLTLHVMSLSDSTITDQSVNQLFARLPTSCIVLMEDIDTIAVSRKADAGTKDEAEAAAEKAKTEAAAEAKAKQEEEDKKTLQRGGGLNRRNASTTTGITLSGLLNAIDGVASQEGRILIMTTNAPEALDPALIRPGRVDRQVYFGFLNKQCAREMFLTMFGPEPASISDSASVSNGASPSDAKTKTIDGKDLSASTADEHLDEARIDKLADQFVDLLPESSFTPAEIQGFLLVRRRRPESVVADFAAWAEETLAAKAAGLNVSRQIEDAAAPSLRAPDVDVPMLPPPKIMERMMAAQ